MDVIILKIKIDNIKNLPFGSYVTVKTLNGKFENAIAIIGSIAFKDGTIIDYEDIGKMEVYLGWE